MRHEKTTGWGRFPVVEATQRRARSLEDLVAFARQPHPQLARGSGLSYGDACLASNLISTIHLNRLLSFDDTLGVLRAEAGVTIEDVIRFDVPRGWFPPVTPGTKFATLGGCVAADVHGKNHQAEGSIATYVDELHMVVAGGAEIRCSRGQNPQLFKATLGGMGLTGFVYAVTLRLKKVTSAFLHTRTERTGDLQATCRLLEDTQAASSYSVAWIDTFPAGGRTGRGLVMLGRHQLASEVDGGPDPFPLHPAPRVSVPPWWPSFLVNRLSARASNALYYRRRWRRVRETVVHYDPYFYPLDAVAHWNRLYGRRGFLQYQFVVPFSAGAPALGDVLECLRRRGFSSYLAVLKTFGPEAGMLSFPMPGFTLTLDFPVGRGAIIPALHAVTRIVRQAGGRVYLAKDAILAREDFDGMYPDLDAFKAVKRDVDPDCLFRSVQSDRLGIT